jgi:hypothetical protein
VRAFALALVAPTHTSLALNECRLVVQAGLRELGHEIVILPPNTFSRDATNIVFAPNMIGHDRAVVPPPGSIFYSFEQAVPHWLDAVAAAAKECAALSVWNWSDHSTALLRDRGAPAITVPLGYHSCLALFEPKANPPIDVCFYGAISPRRQAILEQCVALGLTVEVVPYGEYGLERKRAIEECKVVLNVHYYEGPSRLELVRVLPLLASGCCVVSEKSEDDDLFLVGLRRTSYENLADLCHWVVVEGSWQHAATMARASAKRLRPEREILADALAKTFGRETVA